MKELITLIDEQDNITGYDEKLYVHKQKILHRAFSLFVVDLSSREMLIQKRAKNKYHSGGLWSNTCCSHPRKDENFESAIERCLKDELLYEPKNGIKINPKNICLNEIKELGKFIYYADFGELAEYELDHIFLLNTLKEEMNNIVPVPEEIEELRWINIDDAAVWLKEKPYEFSVWFKPAFEIVCERLYSK